MKKIVFLCMLLMCVACRPSEPVMKSLDASDIVLCYAGGAGGCMFDIEYMNDYVWYKDRDGNPDWLFDGFLLLQIRDIGDGASEVAFDPGHKNKDGSILPAAAQADWMKLIDYYFEDGQCIDAIDKAVEEAAKILGAPPYKRQVVISIPTPIIYKQPLSKKGGTTYWGILDGKVTDFSKEEDRIAACRWFIDEVLERYGTGKWKHVELAGFYWITEETLDESPLLPEVSAYLHSKGYPLTWIPYFEAPGYDGWKDKGFDTAWYQPNYFFNDAIPYGRLETACRQAMENGMAMEIEFDERVLSEPEWGDRSYGYRLRDYMQAFIDSGVWEKCPLAYYQSGSAVRDMKCSSDVADRELYYDFCDFVAKRPYRNSVK